MSEEGTPRGNSPNPRTCAGVRKSGASCTATVTGENKYCWHHDPAREEERKKIAASGGKSKGKPPRIVRIQDNVQDTIDQVKQGKIAPAKAQVMFTGYGVLVRAVEQERKQRELG